MSTRKRFRKYIRLEKAIAEKVRELADFGGVISRITPAEESKTYDRVVILESGKEIKLEVQITESRRWQKYHDVTLDVLSAFYRPPSAPFSGFLRVYPEEVADFLESVKIQRYGKLFECEAETLAFYVTRPTDLLWIFSVDALQKNRDYFLNLYGIMINLKSPDEEWESCFCPVHHTDEVLDKCGVKYDLRGGEKNDG